MEFKSIKQLEKEIETETDMTLLRMYNVELDTLKEVVKLIELKFKKANLGIMECIVNVEELKQKIKGEN
jgi:hypothetical protein